MLNSLPLRRMSVIEALFNRGPGTQRKGIAETISQIVIGRFSYKENIGPWGCRSKSWVLGTRILTTTPAAGGCALGKSKVQVYFSAIPPIFARPTLAPHRPATTGGASRGQSVIPHWLALGRNILWELEFKDTSVSRMQSGIVRATNAEAKPRLTALDKCNPQHKYTDVQYMRLAMSDPRTSKHC